MEAGESASKLNLGLATYGRSFTLQNSSQHGVGDVISGPGKQGSTTLKDGFLAYFEVGTV